MMKIIIIIIIAMSRRLASRRHVLYTSAVILSRTLRQHIPNDTAQQPNNVYGDFGCPMFDHWGVEWTVSNARYRKIRNLSALVKTA